MISCKLNSYSIVNKHMYLKKCTIINHANENITTEGCVYAKLIKKYVKNIKTVTILDNNKTVAILKNPKSLIIRNSNIDVNAEITGHDENKKIIYKYNRYCDIELSGYKDDDKVGIVVKIISQK